MTHGLTVLLPRTADCYMELDRTMMCEGDTALPIELLYLLFALGGVAFVWARYNEWSDRRADRKRREREGESGSEPGRPK